MLVWEGRKMPRKGKKKVCLKSPTPNDFTPQNLEGQNSGLLDLFR